MFAIASVAATALDGFLQEVAVVGQNYVLLQALFTLVPIRYPSFFGAMAGVKSDGLTAIDALRGA